MVGNPSAMRAVRRQRVPEYPTVSLSIRTKTQSTFFLRFCTGSSTSRDDPAATTVAWFTLSEYPKQAHQTVTTLFSPAFQPSTNSKQNLSIVLFPHQGFTCHVRSSLISDVANAVACSIVVSWLDYCNSLLCGISAFLVRRNCIQSRTLLGWLSSKQRTTIASHYLQQNYTDFRLHLGSASRLQC